jgi:hypothetical protein
MAPLACKQKQNPSAYLAEGLTGAAFLPGGWRSPEAPLPFVAFSCLFLPFEDSAHSEKHEKTARQYV